MYIYVYLYIYVYICVCFITSGPLGELVTCVTQVKEACLVFQILLQKSSINDQLFDADDR